MFNKTALALGFGVGLYFLPHVANKEVFLPTVIIAGFIPQLSSLVKRSRSAENSLLDNFFKNYVICIIGAIVLAFLYPIFALPFFLGYSFNLTLSAFSKEGIMPFWPLTKKKTSGPIVSGGKIDQTIFYVLLIVDVALLVKLFL